MLGPGKSVHRQWSPFQIEHHVILYLHTPLSCSFGPRMWRATLRRCSLPKVDLFRSCCPVPTTGPLHLAESRKKENTVPLQDTPATHPDSPTSFQTVLRKIRLSFISYLSCGLHQAAGYEGHLIRPCTTLWCERLSNTLIPHCFAAGSCWR